MPFESAKQRRLIFAKAAQGEAWARKYLRDMGIEPPQVRLSQAIKRRKGNR